MVAAGDWAKGGNGELLLISKHKVEVKEDE